MLERYIALSTLTFLVLSASGCCFIPVPRSYVVFQKVDVTVHDKEGPVENARVTQARYIYHPHFVPETEIKSSVRTDASGKVTFQESTSKEWVMPLMMHGVPGFGWQLCVEADGYESAYMEIEKPFGEDAGDAWRQLDVVLEPGRSAACDSLLGREEHLRH